MKRNSITKKIISLVLSVLMLSSCWVFAPIEASALTTTWPIEFPQDYYEGLKDTNKDDIPADKWFNDSGFGLIEGLCVNGNTLKKSKINSNSLIFIDSSYQTLAYCIEPGKPVNGGENGSNLEAALKSEDDTCEILAQGVRNGATKVSKMTKDIMKMYLRNILGYGYMHDNSRAYKWRFVDDNNNITQDAYKFSYAYATQLLVWELVCGERDENFNRIRIPEDLPAEEQGKDYISIYKHCIKSTNPLKDIIDNYYREIEANVKKATPDLDSTIINKTFTFEANADKKIMEVVIPDSNGLLKHTTSIQGLDNATITHDGTKLTISVPYRFAKEGEYQLSYTVYGKMPKNITFYTPGDSQDVVVATGGLSDISSTGTLKLILPHHHEWVPHVINPTCTTEGLTCMICKCGNIYTKTITPALNHNHETSAWIVGQQATCTEDGELIQICERCNTVIDSKPIPKTGHNGVWIIETEPTADHDGQMVLYCTKCGNRTETKSYEHHKHEFGYDAVVRDATCTSEGLKGKFCKLCGVCYDTSTIPAGHSESLVWVTTLQPTCTAEGERSAFCSDCGDIVTTKSVEATGHSEGTWITSIAPYCGLSGEEVCYCDKCGEITDSREIEALIHDEGVWKIKNDPTCELDGEKVKSCTRCGHIIETEAIEALGHDEGVWKIDIEATADLDGSMNRYCTRCSMVLETKTFTLHTHEEGYKATLLQPTCTRDGEKGTVCGICNAVYATEEVDSLGHDYSEFYTEANGTHSKSCSRCHYVYTENCGYETIESVEATCTTAGYKTHKCTVCAYTYSNSFVPPYGHTLGKWSSEGKSTHMRYCTDCGVMEISKHVWGEYFSNNDGDFIEEGSKTRSCIYCGESQTIGKPASIIKSAYKATMNLLDFLIKLFGALSVFAEELANFLEKV